MAIVRMVLVGVIVAAVSVIGCSGGEETSNNDDASQEASSTTNESGDGMGHGPHGTGPNGGVIFDLGKHHAEFTVDHDNETCMILVVGLDEKTPVPVAADELTLTTKETKTADGTVVASMTVTLLPEDAEEGKATTFVGKDAGIGNVADFEGTVIGVIDGKPSQGEFSEAEGHSH